MNLQENFSRPKYAFAKNIYPFQPIEIVALPVKKGQFLTIGCFCKTYIEEETGTLYAAQLDENCTEYDVYGIVQDGSVSHKLKYDLPIVDEFCNASILTRKHEWTIKPIVVDDRQGDKTNLPDNIYIISSHKVEDKAVKEKYPIGAIVFLDEGQDVPYTYFEYNGKMQKIVS